MNSLNVTIETQLLKSLLLSLLYMFRALLAHHDDDGREVPETCRAVIIIKISKSCISLVTFKEYTLIVYIEGSHR